MVYAIEGKTFAKSVRVIKRDMEIYEQLSQPTYLCNYHVALQHSLRYDIES